jgi:hypothetical protein
MTCPRCLLIVVQSPRARKLILLTDINVLKRWTRFLVSDGKYRIRALFRCAPEVMIRTIVHCLVELHEFSYSCQHGPAPTANILHSDKAFRNILEQCELRSVVYHNRTELVHMATYHQ